MSIHSIVEKHGLSGALDSEFQRMLRREFASLDEKTLSTALDELLKFLTLASQSTESTFFPGNELLDKLWHFLILQTQNYSDTCQRLGSGRFLHHSSLEYEKYTEKRSPEAVHTERLSWITNYVRAFGPFTDATFEMLPVLRSISSTLGLSLNDINALAKAILKSKKSSPINAEELLNKVFENRCQIDSNSLYLNNYSHRTLELIHLNKIDKNKSDWFSFLEQLYFSCPALAFTIHQHLAAKEHFKKISDNCSIDTSILNLIMENKLPTGLATTHLIRDESPINAETTANGDFKISGQIPWVTGIKFFDAFVLGFRHESYDVFCLVNKASISESQIEFHDLEVFRGTSTGKINFSGFLIKKNQIIYRRNRPGTEKIAFPDFHFSEIGIARGCLENVRKNISKSRIKEKALCEALRGLTNEYEHIKNIRLSAIEKTQLYDLWYRKDRLIENSVQILAYQEGPRALLADSLSRPLASEITFLKGIIQPIAVLNLKINNLIPC